MIRRKIWATATYCLAIAGAAQAQNGTTSKASLGSPQKEPAAFLARGVAPNAGYPTYVPRNYTAPTPPGYSSAAPLGPPSSGAVSTPVELFAVEADPVPPTGPAPMSPVPASPTPMPMPSVPGTVSPAPVVIDQGMMQGVPINGGPINADAPYLDGTGYYGDGALPTVWATGEYLHWKFRGVPVPPLVSTAQAGSPGTINDPATFVTYGGREDILNNWNSGFRVRAGCWFPDGTSGIDVGYMRIKSAQERTLIGSNGDQGIFRPFFNTAIGAEDAQLIAFTDPIAGPIVSGRVGTNADSTLLGFELNYRSGFGMGFGGKLDALVGYRYLSLNDRVQLQSQVNTLVPVGNAGAGTTILADDRFETFNTFNGGQVGFVGEWMLGAMTFGVRGTLGVGMTTQRVEIAGVTTSHTPAGTSVISAGGLLAQSTNIGDHTRDRISFLPEIGVTLGYQVTNNIRIFGGFNALCWTNVVRAGEQINRNVNGTFIADPLTGVRNPIGAPAPTFHHRDEYFYGYGCSLGFECRW